MSNWPIALFAATGLSGLLAFGIIQSSFTPQAQALFYVFAAALLLTFAAKKIFGGGGHAKGHGKPSAHGAHGHGERALLFSGRAIGTMMIAAGALGAIFFWTDNDLTAEKVGRQIDGGVASVGRQAQATYVALREDTPAEKDATAQN
ncbi:MAG: hypothetical protein H7124_06020 [Phycisphaerales bacterium]|nr:hypothetical protein [Hyphomonadaceae bacterium]